LRLEPSWQTRITLPSQIQVQILKTGMFLCFSRRSMHKVYLLLRNNKQQGPYTLEELLQQSLKPLDLVWVEGKSAGWKYPTEIDALKNHVVQTSQPAEVKEKAPVAEPIRTAVLTEQKKPGGRNKIYVSMPGGADPSIQMVEEESFSQKLEKKAEELYRRAQAYAEKKKEEAKLKASISAVGDTELQTNYARSLDDIKEEYSNWLYEQKANKKGSKRKMSLTVTATIVILLVGFTTAKLVFSKKHNSIAPAEKMQEPITATEKTIPEFNSSTLATKNSKKTSIHSAKGIVNTTNKKTTAANSKEKKSGSYPNKNKDAIVQKPETSSVPLTDLVRVTGQYVSNKNDIPDFIITVQNNSDEALRFVAVDLYYYQNDGSPAGKNTIYFNGVSPHQTMSQKSRADNQANIVLKMRLMRTEDRDMNYAYTGE
jgi:hypothetical protein